MDKVKKRGIRDLFPFFVMGCLYFLIYSLALLIEMPFEASGVSVFPNPNDPSNVVNFFLMLILFTAAILVLARYRKKLVQGIILGSIGFFFFYILFFLLVDVLPDVFALGSSIATSMFLVAMLLKYPEWYVIDICGILMATGSVAMFGISLSIPLVITLLVGLSVYDALSVYVTRHMIDLADIVMDLRLPVIFVIPKTRSYSTLKEGKSLKEKLDEEEEREAFYVGLGDVIVPGILVASAFYNLEYDALLIAFAVMLGIIAGFAALTMVVIRGRPQAGLPFLCSGAILGYVASSFLISGGLMGI